MAHWMFSCKSVSQKISKSLDCRLSLSQRLMIWIHLAMCRLCRRASKQISRLREIARDSKLQEAGMDESVSLSSEACTRIKEILRSQGPSF